MGILDFFKAKNINEGVEEFINTEKAVLLDVRTPQEYREERIPYSINIPLDSLQRVVTEISEKSTPLFVHCHSGVRSGQAVLLLKRMGYTNIVNIGGIMNYKGKKESG